MTKHDGRDTLPSKGVRYQVRRKLGEGGMATVYLAHDATLDREVVVKLPHAFLLKEKGFAERFRREIRALVKLSHPHIVQILDVGEHDGGPFAVLQYLTGGTLEDLPNPLESLREWLPAIADALDFIHEQGYVHRDVKPSNILFDDRGNAFLADFGIAKAVSDKASENQKTLTGTGMALGTPDYMAPELVLGQPYDGRADQYALAAVLYEIYSGEPVFAGNTPIAIMMKHASDTPDSLRERDGLIPTALSDAIEQGLAKDSNTRYENCQALAESVLRANEAYLWARDNRDSKETVVHSAETSVTNLPARKQASVLAALNVTSPHALVAVIVGTCLLGLIATVGVRYFGHGFTAEQSALSSSNIPVREEEGIDAESSTLDDIEVKVAKESTSATKSETQKEQVGLIPDAINSTVSKEESIERRDAEEATETRDGEEIGNALPISTVTPIARENSSAGIIASSPPGGTSDGVSDNGTGITSEVNEISPSFTNSIGMTLNLIPAGELLMGSPESEDGRDDDEQQHRVTITKPFYMATTEVTQGQWTAVMATAPWKEKVSIQEIGRSEVTYREASDYAVTYVNWNDAVEFCLRLSERDGRKYHLPTEAQWEFACRADSTTRYSFGDSATALKEYAWFIDNPSDVNEKYAHAVGQLRPNDFGLYDMHGNVYEWCSDFYDDTYYSRSLQSDPNGPESGDYRVYRGGGWNMHSHDCRSADREHLVSSDALFNIGLRVCSSVVDKSLTRSGGATSDSMSKETGIEAAKPTSEMSTSDVTLTSDDKARFPTDEDLADARLRSPLNRYHRRIDAYSPDSRRYVVAEDHTLYVLDLETRERLAKLEARDSIDHVAISKDGVRVAASRRGGIDLWDIGSKPSYASHEASNVEVMEFDNDGDCLAYARGARLFYVRINRYESRDGGTYVGFGGAWGKVLQDASIGDLCDISFSANGKLIAATGGVAVWDGIRARGVAIWSVETRSLVGGTTNVPNRIRDDSLQFENPAQLSAEVSDGSRQIVFPR